MSRYIGIRPTHSLTGPSFVVVQGSGRRPNNLIELTGEILRNPDVADVIAGTAKKIAIEIGRRTFNTGLAGVSALVSALIGDNGPEEQLRALEHYGETENIIEPDIIGNPMTEHESESEVSNLIRRLAEDQTNVFQIGNAVSQFLFSSDLDQATKEQFERIGDEMERILGDPIEAQEVNRAVLTDPNAWSDATNPDMDARLATEALEELQNQRESDKKDDEIRKLLVGQQSQMRDNNERSPDQWLARVQALRQALYARPVSVKSNYELVTAGLVEVPYYSTKVQQ